MSGWRGWLAALATVLVAVSSIGAATAAPRLAGEASPYLQSHRGDAVDWWPWGLEALAEAKRTQKPILLSIGYLACHWCHVLQSESFANATIGRMINENFIPVLVDREERPEIDDIYQRAASLLGSQTGWPLNVFLAPDGVPFFAVGYLPPERRQGLPPFTEALGVVAETYREQHGEVAAISAALGGALRERLKPEPGEPSRAALERAVAELNRNVDVFNGGFGAAPKFPRLTAIESLWRGYLRKNSPPLREAVSHALDAMSRGGLYDHLGGGFSRYTTDPEWRIPHFEKMLDVNAQFITLMTDVWRETRSPLLAERLRESVAFVLGEMRLPGGGFATAIDADSEGREGAFYVWTDAQIDRALGKDATLFKRVYGVTAEGNWEGMSVLYLAEPSMAALRERFGAAEGELASRLVSARARLRAVRDTRPRPRRDDKVLADWNGAMIAALAEAGAAFGEPVWLTAAQAAFAFVRTNLDGPAGLRHSWSAARSGLPATLDDFAQMARAAVILFEATGKDEYLAAARAWIAAAEPLWDDGPGGYFLAARPDLPQLPLAKVAVDTALPAGNAVMADVVMRVYHLTGEPLLRTRAERAVGAFFGAAEGDPLQSSGILNAADTLMAAMQIVIVGDRAQADTQTLLATAWHTSLPGRVLQVIAPGAVLPQSHPARFKDQEGGRATAYVCVGQVCSLPATTVNDLRETLVAMRGRSVP
ncbi:MAG: thioredoxin domain-containing protein [Proteobacteria bacterium]|nr:thioredoxin domain-containing protein [Pseudomonadota bacterium]